VINTKVVANIQIYLHKNYYSTCLENQKGKGISKLENLPGLFSLRVGLALQCLGPSPCASLPVTARAPQSLPVGTRLSGAFFPQSSLAPTSCVITGEFPITKPSTHRFLLASVLPPVHPHLGVIVSPLVQCGVLSTLASTLCLAPRCAARMLVPTAR
jgi:hypothetical protein